ncbi:MAG: hypothetical protein JST04_13440 [Bdellovibrionales bacterium]|nr:hypothetical protein [Bdellovibrionales bacterium]
MQTSSGSRALGLVGGLAVLAFASPFVLPREAAVAVPFAASAVALFRFGVPLQIHALGSLRRFRVTSRTIVWFAAVVAFWYSTVVWVWWSRRTPNFPLFLLNAELEPRYYFAWVPALVFGGLLLGRERA